MNHADKARNLCSDLAFSDHSDLEIKKVLRAEGLEGVLEKSDFELTVMMARRAKKKQPATEFLITRILALGAVLWGCSQLYLSRGSDIIVSFGGYHVPVQWVAYPAIGLGIGFLLRPKTTLGVMSWFRH